MSFWNKLKNARDRNHPRCAVLVPAAGSSRRMDGIDKMLAPLGGMPILMRTLLAIDHARFADEIIVATREDLLLEVADICAHAAIEKPVKVIRGGDSRSESVLAAALECSPETEYLAVHDGARPLIRPEKIDELISACWKTNAVAPAVSVSDTVKVADESGLVTATPDRSTLFAVQTPQVFQADLLKAALQAALTAGCPVTDDCSAVERIGKSVYLIPGDRENIKITTPVDLILAEALLQQEVAP